MDVVVDTLITEEDRPEHIAKHNISLGEVIEALAKDYLIIKARFSRQILIAKTSKQKYLAVVIGKRPEKNTWG